jgi:5'-deoxynucleotidase YfbR-like HD superfamily hydrolase
MRLMADKAGTPPRAWQRMLSGRRLDLLDPSPLDIEIGDIAHGLARVARWNGQTRGDHAFSVAQHSLLVHEIFVRLSKRTDAEACLAALLHDAAEYVIGDMISPFKAVVGGGYKQVETNLQRAIHLRFSLPPETPAALKASIKRADSVAAWFEAIRLAGFDETEAARYFRRPRGFTDEILDLDPKPAWDVEAEFLARYDALERKRNT